MLYLKQSTAATVQIGPFLDATDAVTAETGLTLSQADIRLSKNGGDWAQKNDANACTHDEAGWYTCALDATDTNTPGRLQLAAAESGALPIWHEYTVLPAVVFDSQIAGSDYLQVDLLQVEGSDASGALTAAVPTAAQIRAEIDTHSTQLAAILEDTAAIPTPPTAAAIADQVWDEAIAGHASAGSTGATLTSAAASTPAGAGAIAWTMTLTDASSNPIPEVDVWATSDADGDVVLASGETNSAGQVTLYLDAGAVYVWAQKAGYNFCNPTSVTIT